MKIKLLLAFILSIALNLFSPEIHAQNFQWVNHQTHNIQSNPDLTSFLSETDAQGNSMIASIYSYKLSYNGYYGDISLKKYNSSGMLVFNKILSGKILTEGLQTDSDGNIYVSGSFMDTLKIDEVNFILNTGSGLNLNYFILKLSPAGDFIWKKNINSEYPSSTTRLDAMKIKNGNLLTGMANGLYLYIRKFDLNGNELLSILHNRVVSISSIDIDSQGNIFAGGSCPIGNLTFGNKNFTGPHVYNIYFVKYNPAGSCLWVKFVEDITFQNVDVQCDHSDNLLAAGDLNGSFAFGNIQTQGRQWVYDFFLTKLDPQGNFLWVKEVPNTPTITGDARKAKVNAISVDALNNVYLTGLLRNTVNWGNNIITTTGGAQDILLLKYDQNGNILFGKRAGGIGNDRADDISLSNSGDVYISGNFSSTAAFDTISATGAGNINSYLAKLPSSTCIIDLKLIVEGFYDIKQDNMRLNDTVNLYVRSSSSPYAVLDSSKAAVNSISFEASFPLYNTSAGNYYIQVKQRNSLETWSKIPVTYTPGQTISYDFTNSQDKAYGNNLASVNNTPERFAVYSGDVNNDGIIDLTDIIIVFTDASDFKTGYLLTDVNGDNLTDLTDIVITYTNSSKFVHLERP